MARAVLTDRPGTRPTGQKKVRRANVSGGAGLLHLTVRTSQAFQSQVAILTGKQEPEQVNRVRVPGLEQGRQAKVLH